MGKVSLWYKMYDYHLLPLSLCCYSGSALSVVVRVIIADGVKSSKDDVRCFLEFWKHFDSCECTQPSISV